MKLTRTVAARQAARTRPGPRPRPALSRARPLGLLLGFWLCAALCVWPSSADAKDKPKPPPPAASPAAASAAGPSDCPPKDAAKKSVTVNINTASEKDLRCELDGITDALAREIIANRPYDKADDLLNRNVLMSGVFQKIQAHITVTKGK